MILLGKLFTVCLAFTYVRSETEIDLTNVGLPVKFPLNAGDRLNVELFVHLRKALTTLKESAIDSGQFLHDVKSTAVGQQCAEDVGYLFNDTSVLMLYLDAFGKDADGLLQQNWFWAGDMKECSNIPAVYNNITKHMILSRYMVVAFYWNAQPVFKNTGKTIVTGVCVPRSCNESDVPQVVNYGIHKYVPNLTAVLSVTADNKKLDIGAVTFLSITGVLCAVILIATIVDYVVSDNGPVNVINKTEHETSELPYSEHHDDRSRLLSGDLFASNDTELSAKFSRMTFFKVVQIFSVYTNGKKLFGTETAVGPLSCLNGMRVVSMWWVITGHTYAFVNTFVDNNLEAAKLITRFSFQPILNGSFSVDTFFFLSGLLVTYHAVKEIKEKRVFSWVYYVFHRYWRLTPIYAFVIFYYAYVYIFTVNGPWHFLFNLPDNGLIDYRRGLDLCKKYWWTNLLYINNFYPNNGSLSGTCLGWGWYLANDMQFYIIIGPLLLLPIWITYIYQHRITDITKKVLRLTSLIVAVVLVIACVAIRFGLTYYYGIFDLFLGQPTKHKDEAYAISGPLYVRPYARCSVYVIGMLTGYVLAAKRNRIVIHRLLAFIGWCFAFGVGLAVIYGQYYYYHRLLEPNPPHMTQLQSAFYISLSRTAWALCLAWVVFACVAGKGGAINDILSWKIWAPLGRLTYAAYLVHPIVIFTYYLSLPKAIHFSDIEMVSICVSMLVVSYVVAFVVSMIVEAPMIQLEKFLLPRLKIRARIQNRFPNLLSGSD